MEFFFPINIHRSPVTEARERSLSTGHLKKVADMREELVEKRPSPVLSGTDFNLETGGTYTGFHKK